jgi:hypothetical protein
MPTPAMRLFSYGLSVYLNENIRLDAREAAAARNMNLGFQQATEDERAVMVIRAATAKADHLLQPAEAVA